WRRYGSPRGQAVGRVGRRFGREGPPVDRPRRPSVHPFRNKDNSAFIFAFSWPSGRNKDNYALIFSLPAKNRTYFSNLNVQSAFVIPGSSFSEKNKCTFVFVEPAGNLSPTGIWARRTSARAGKRAAPCGRTLRANPVPVADQSDEAKQSPIPAPGRTV